MPTLPTMMIRTWAPFTLLFSERVWQHVQMLLAGAILAPGKRTVSSALRAMGLDREKRFHCYHLVLSRAAWSSRQAGTPRACLPVPCRLRPGAGEDGVFLAH